MVRQSTAARARSANPANRPLKSKVSLSHSFSFNFSECLSDLKELLQISSWAFILVVMSTPTTKSTYSLDAGTIRKLESMARQWGVSKSEALRRAVKSASVNGHKKEGSALRALVRLQDSLRLKPAKARAWARNVRAERRASSSRLEPRRR